MLYHVNLGFVAATQIEIIDSYFHSTWIGLVASWTVEHPINSSKTESNRSNCVPFQDFFM